ncbi:MAG: YolD-like family protein [Lachnospiraceae bacterium]|nr:YolD-like family protein [Lachnospiraceae bacterium]
MASKPKHKMPIADRAKQFMPFAALKGLPEALAAREKILVARITLSPEMADELDRKMHHLKKGQMASVIYFHQDEYIKITGLVARIDPTCRVLQIVNTKICFDDILDVNIV